MMARNAVSSAAMRSTLTISVFRITRSSLIPAETCTTTVSSVSVSPVIRPSIRSPVFRAMESARVPATAPESPSRRRRKREPLSMNAATKADANRDAKKFLGKPKRRVQQPPCGGSKCAQESRGSAPLFRTPPAGRLRRSADADYASAGTFFRAFLMMLRTVSEGWAPLVTQ